MSLELVRDAATPVERAVADLTARVEQTARDAFVAGFALGNQQEGRFINDDERDAVAIAIWEAKKP